MDVPLEVTYRNATSIDAHIRERVRRLERYDPHLVSCRVTVEPTRVHLELTTPPKHEIVVDKEQGSPDDRKSTTALVNEAFDAAARQLEKHTQQRRGRRKPHEEQQLRGVVEEIFDDYGLIRTVDHREIYFHAKSVLSPGFDHLEPGAGVAFEEELGEDGLEASSIRIVDGRGHDPNGDSGR